MIFEKIPGNFFVPLSSPNREVYWECLVRLFSLMDHQMSFGLKREILADELQYYFDRSYASEIMEDDCQASDSREKANYILRKLEYYGWIEVETDRNYVQRVNFREHGVKVLKTLLEIEEGKQIEYQGYIYTIYSLLNKNSDYSGIILLQIHENMDMLITGLKNLNSHIKSYIDGLTRQRTVSQIMDVLLNDYMDNIVDKAYHRLLTSDNISKFRPVILETLESHSRDEDYIRNAASQIAIIKEMTEEEARETVCDYLHQTIEGLKGMDGILEEINQKNTQYQRAAINRAKFLLAGDEDIRGQLKEILSELNKEIEKKRWDPGGIYEIDFLEGLVRLSTSFFLDEHSLYVPLEGQREFVPQKVSHKEDHSQRHQEKLKTVMEKMKKVLSKERVEAYIRSELKEKEAMMASELPLETTEDFVKIIYIRLYGQRKHMSYRIEMERECDINGFRFRDFCIRRK